MVRTFVVVVVVVSGAAFSADAAAPLTWTGRYGPLPGNVAASPFVTPVSVRNLGMGGAGVADPSAPANAVYNPANLIGDDGVFAFYDTYHLYELIDVRDIGVAATKTWWGSGVRGAIAVRQQLNHYDQSFERVVFFPSGTATGLTSDDRGTGVTAAIGVPVGSVDLAVGAGAEYATVEVVDNVHAWAFDVGASVGNVLESARGDRFETRAGVSVLNMGRGFESGTVRSDSPRQVRAGFSASYASTETMPTLFSGHAPISTLSLALDFVLDDPTIESPTEAVGLEYAFARTLSLRFGYSGASLTRDDGFSFGAGLAGRAGPLRLRADWSFSPERVVYANNVHVWGFAVEYCPSGGQTAATGD